MSDIPLENGTIHRIDGIMRIHYDGYWIRYYNPPEETPSNQRELIVSLTKRAFHHTERGINTPGYRLEDARRAWDKETDPARKRVNAAMLAGALFNRATDIFTSVVDLDNKGVHISRKNELMKSCGDNFREALDIGKQVRHYSGEEGIDELWGEPFKAFTMTIANFYQQRYIKIAQTMRDIDAIASEMITIFGELPAFDGIEPLLLSYASASRADCETNKSDNSIFDVWPRYVAAGEALVDFRPNLDRQSDPTTEPHLNWALSLIRQGSELMRYISGARVPMPVSTGHFIQELRRFSLESGPYLQIPSEAQNA